MSVIKTFTKNYGYGSFIGVLSSSDDKEWRKATLKYYQVFENGTLRLEKESGKETIDLEKLARKYINSQNDFVLWTY